MKFPDAFDPLLKALNQDRLAHAYLIYGRRPAALSPLVLKFLKRTVCQQSEPSSCGECSDCLQIESLSHPDLHVINPPADVLAEDQPSRRSRIGVDRVRDEIIAPASLTSTRGPYTLFWLSDIGEFTVQASNALLKVLEEPPGETIFLLTARSLGDSLPTIRSRCQWIRLRPQQIEWEQRLDACNDLWPDECWQPEDQNQWEELIERKRSSRTIDWSESKARGFLTWLLLTIRDQHTRQNKPNDQINKSIPYRLIPEILDRLHELEQGGSPIFTINSLLESLYYPEEMSPCQTVI